MSRFSAVSDLDYTDRAWDAPEPCATAGCEGVCDIPMSSSHCYLCRCQALLDRARENEAHQREQEAERRRKSGA